MIDRRLFPVLGFFCLAIVGFDQSQVTAPGQTTGAAPPKQTTGLTPPIQPKTPNVEVPPAVDLTGTPVSTPGVPNKPLTADEAAQIALHKQPNVLIAAAQVQAAHGQTAQQRAALYPQLNVTQSYSRSETFVSPKSTNSNAAGVPASGFGPPQATTTGTTSTTTGTTATTTGTTATTTGSTVGTTGTTATTTGTTATTTGTTVGTTGTTATTTGTTATTTGTTVGTTGTTGSSTTTTGTTSGTTSGSNGSLLKPEGFSGGLNLTQLLFDFNHTRDLVRQFEAQERAAKYGYTKAQIDTILQVKQAFYAYVQNQQLVDVENSAVKAAQASLNQAQASLNVGLGAPADVVNAKTNLANTVQALLQARVTALSSRISLCQDMGIDPRTPFAPSTSSEPEEPPGDVNALVDQAVKGRPDVLQAIENVKAFGYEVSAARTSNAPSLNFQLNANNLGARNPLSTDIFGGALNLVWSLEDGGLARGRVESAQADVEIAKQQLQLITDAAVAEVAQAFVAVKTAEQRVTVADAQVQNATENLRLAQGQYAAGVTEFVTVITAQAQLVQAQSDQVSAIATLSQARATLTHSLGH